MLNHYKYTDKELQTLLRSLTVIIDTREQQNAHIVKWLTDKHIPHTTRKLDYGDYSFYLPKNESLGVPRDMHFTNEISIERKAGLVELSGNFTNDRLRIETEFIQHKGKMYLVIENARYADIVNHKYATEYKPESFLATLHSFSDRYNVPFVFVDKQHTAQYIYYTFYYWMRNWILYN